jgi:signal transduction histidine kinase
MGHGYDEGSKQRGEKKIMLETSIRPYFSWEIAGCEESSRELRPPQPRIVTHPGQNKSQYREQSAELRHDMANILTLLQLRLAIVKKAQTFGDDETLIFEQSLARLRTLLEYWKRLEVESASQPIQHDEFVDLYEVAAQIIRMYHPVIDQKGQTIDLVMSPGSGKVTGQRILYERLIDNLISNATKYTGHGGQLEITIDIGESRIRLEVSDTGIGMSQAEIDCIFDRYYRTEAAQSYTPAGSGLGLSVVKEIVECLDGEITVYSQVGLGSTFIIRLPNRQLAAE